MKVLQRETGGDKWQRETKCHGCKATLLIDKNDLHVINTAVGYAGETYEPEIAVTCPDCTSEIQVDVPFALRNQLIDRHRGQK